MRTSLASGALLTAALGVLAAAACTSFSDAPVDQVTPGSTGGTGGVAGMSGGSGQAGATPAAGTGGTGGAAGASGAGTGGSSASPSGVCTPPLAAVVTTGGDRTVVGTGTPASCTEDAFTTALAKGGVIVFDCGAAPVTIVLTTEKPLSKTSDTVIDGGGTVTLEGNNQHRLLSFDGGKSRTTTTTITLQHLTLRAGRATGTPIPHAQSENPCIDGTEIDGGGGAIRVHDGILHVIDVRFEKNSAALLGPDVSGGAIDIRDSLGLIVVGSTFTENQAANGGAIGLATTDATIVNSHFQSHQAAGFPVTTDVVTCGDTPAKRLVQRGGQGGAITSQGGVGKLWLCGDSFAQNTSRLSGGAVARSVGVSPQETTIDRCSFDLNHADGQGGAVEISQSAQHPFTVRATTFSTNDSGLNGGALHVYQGTCSFENVTVANNRTKLLGGGFYFTNVSGTVASATFAGNRAYTGAMYFGAAIAGYPELTVTNSLFADNLTLDCGGEMACQVIATGGPNLQWPDKHTVCTKTDNPCGGSDGTTFVDPDLADLADNGGPTLTIAPKPGSAAIGKGDKCPDTDQRGQKRQSPCTLGALEVL